MKRDKIIYWTATIIFVVFDGVLPAFTSHTEMAKQGISHLGYPDYFRILLTIFKVTGALVLIIPKLPVRLKEWAYAGFTFSLISACVSLAAVDGVNGQTFFPLVAFAILMVSYVYYHKLYTTEKI